MALGFSGVYELLVVFLYFILMVNGAVEHVTVYTNATTLTIDEYYISATLDASLWWQNDDGFELLTSDDLQLYAKNYAPSYLRFGGTAGDMTCYDFPSSNYCQ